MTFPHPITPNVFIPRHAVEVHSARSSGKGGQHVNKTSSKAELHVSMEGIEGLSPRALERLRSLAQHRLDAEGRLLLVCDLHREFRRNLDETLEKAARLIRQSLKEPKIRRATKATRSSKLRRLESKGRRSEIKKRRRSLDD
ncbi:MAG: alternative ribosome rescue aminoacyl-tRNA hydrolase ArfB [Planctomycetota bacterium]